jgi:hypothetical protein
MLLCQQITRLRMNRTHGSGSASRHCEDKETPVSGGVGNGRVVTERVEVVVVVSMWRRCVQGISASEAVLPIVGFSSSEEWDRGAGAGAGGFLTLSVGIGGVSIEQSFRPPLEGVLDFGDLCNMSSGSRALGGGSTGADWS